MNKPFIVAEMSANHLGDLARAHRIIDAAAGAGADAIKFQTFTPEQMVDPDKVIEAGPWAGWKAIDLYRKAHTPREWHVELFDHARNVGLTPFSSVFHPDDVDFLETLDCPIYKIASFELLDTLLIEHAARTKKPMIISTGMAGTDEVANATSAAFLAGCLDMTILQCTSAYPADASEANLCMLPQMRKWAMDSLSHHPSARIKLQVGLSDHTLGIGVAVAAVALGATVIEKHLTISRLHGGPDAEFSMEPDEFAQLVAECRRAAAAIGTVRYGPTPGEAASLLLRRKPGGKRGD